MTAADLIAELQKLQPYKKVRICINKHLLERPNNFAESIHAEHRNFYPHQAQDVGRYTVLTVQPEWR